jgi:hypothetical protein
VKRFFAIAAAAIVALAAAGCKPQDNNGANGADVRIHLRKVCAEDIQKYCSGKTGKEMRQCIKANLYQVSDECRSAWKARRAQIRARKAAREAQGQTGTTTNQPTTQAQPPAGQQTQTTTPPANNDGDDDDDRD